MMMVMKMEMTYMCDLTESNYETDSGVLKL